VSGVDGDGDGPHGGHGLHQGVLLTGRHVHEAGVVGRVEGRVIVTRQGVLEEEGERDGPQCDHGSIRDQR